MLHGFQKKILPLTLSLALILNLILIPGIRSKADSYAIGDITYTYHDQNFQFKFLGASPHSNYMIHDSVLEYVIEKTAEAHNISISSGIGASISGLISNLAVSIYNFVRNYLIIFGFGSADNWFDKSSTYGWEYNFTSFDDNYPGHETYGTAYGFRFTGILGEKIDLVLQSDGTLYGSNPIGNVTFSSGQEDLADWSVTQEDDGDIYMPSVSVSTFGDLKPPYFEGNTLVFFAYNDGVEHRCTIPNFERCLCVYQPWNTSGQSTYPGYLGFIDYQDNGSISNSNRLYIDGTLSSLGKSGRKVTFTYKGLYQYQKYMILYNFNNWQLDVNLPMYQPSTYQATNFNTISNGNVKGILSSQPQYATCELLYLDILTTSPLPDPIVLPVDDPIPVSNIDPDPVVFDPDPDDDPDPVPGIDYPTPDPTPIPTPPLPPLVSGNDDLWPDMNGVFEVESEIDGFLGGLSNFEFTPLRTLVEGFASSLMWVSTIMMALYNGSDFSILFVVLSIFFIAAALLGIYKWWTH